MARNQFSLSRYFCAFVWCKYALMGITPCIPRVYAIKTKRFKAPCKRMFKAHMSQP
ncbi:hypothetical protein BDV25DRAFT_159517 [Aspergillus avenaceus]|uniref:Uncharacterized protein n=1 Tax=Aspergillus avenaceus TaxID=36643 RepID=A0A5N6TN99_ASPAV|nr:hypothetical protein BDV25DRAFT_159517 [Aspergillus avenaceus]